jgi:PTS system nitrogen regulatory IIA component
VSDRDGLAQSEVLLTIKELARYLNVNERTVLRLAGENELPAVRIGNQWRFRKNIIDAWLDDQMLGVIPRRLRRPLPREKAPRTVKLEDCFAPSHIRETLEATTEMGVITELATFADELGLIRDRVWFTGALVLREDVYSTAAGKGIAFPHTIQRHPEQVVRPFMLLGRSAEGVAYRAPDDRPVHFFFLLGLGYNELHLPWLARISGMMMSSGLFRDMLTAKDSNSLYQRLVDAQRTAF